MNEEARAYKILFLCTGNSARSILAEYLLRRLDRRRFETYSAGSQPRGEVNPLALQVLRDVYKIDASDARSKSWKELRDIGFDFVITVCDNARESCPVWPGQPIVAHWGMDDPDAFEGAAAEKLRAFKDTARLLYRRLELLCNLPLEKLDRLRLEQSLREIGQSPVIAASS
ncbi:MAG TPA: arsenate reductase ArsC [Thermoanaerobaculia bacterium]|nr:arsenate reductase ArsC [Thermoanaerobaculia bacterium]